mmetsp:Transcript_4928/g.5696  ORF Transcript_4928/g.5696 Transcript_4928/m.5696 type:complete len:284 (-) Transcript_4928:1308-2159(-)
MASPATLPPAVGYSLVPMNAVVPTPKKTVELPQYKSASLLQFKGNKQLAVKEVPLRLDSMNSGDVFVLDSGSTLYQWNGKKANDVEMEKADRFIQSVIASRGLSPKNHVRMHEGRDKKKEAEMMQSIPNKVKWFGSRGYVKRRFEIKDEKEGGSDKDVAAFRKKIYLVKFNQKDKAVFTKVAEAKKGKNGSQQKFARKKLQSKEMFVMDDGFHVWIWVGRETNVAAGFQANRMTLNDVARRYMKKKKRPRSLPVTAAVEGEEPKEFLDQFGHYRKKKWYKFWK